MILTSVQSNTYTRRSHLLNHGNLLSWMAMSATCLQPAAIPHMALLTGIRPSCTSVCQQLPLDSCRISTSRCHLNIQYVVDTCINIEAHMHMWCLCSIRSNAQPRTPQEGTKHTDNSNNNNVPSSHMINLWLYAFNTYCITAGSAWGRLRALRWAITEVGHKQPAAVPLLHQQPCLDFQQLPWMLVTFRWERKKRKKGAEHPTYLSQACCLLI